MKKKIKKETIVKILLCCVLAMVVLGWIWFVVTQIRKATLKPPQDSFYFFEGCSAENEDGMILFYYDAQNGTVTEYDKILDYNVTNVFMSNDKTMLLGKVCGWGQNYTERYFFRYEIETRQKEWISIKEIEDRTQGRYYRMCLGEGSNHCVYFYMYIEGELQYYVYDFDLDCVAQIPKIPNENNRRTSNIGELVGEDRGISMYSFSQDGSKVLYEFDNTGFIKKLYVYDLDTGEKTCVASGVRFGEIGWAGDSYIYEEAYIGVFDYMNPTIITGALDAKEVKVSVWENCSLGSGSHEIIDNQ